MNLRSINLNLLVVFDAIMTENNISRGAHKVGVTPSAVSHTLRRPRDTFGDELFDRTSDGLAPTQRALDLYRRVRSGLVEIERDQQLNFDFRTSERTFKWSTYVG